MLTYQKVFGAIRLKSISLEVLATKHKKAWYIYVPAYAHELNETMFTKCMTDRLSFVIIRYNLY